MAITTYGGKETIDPSIPFGLEIATSKNDDVIEMSGETANETKKEEEVTEKFVPIRRPYLIFHRG